MVRIKICGITNLDDAKAAVEFGSDALGFVFFKQSPRYVAPERAREIVKRLPPFIATVGVFANESPPTIDKIIETAGLTMVQLHGDEPQEMCDMWPRVIKAFRVKDFTDLDVLKEYTVSAYLLDAYSPESYGGTGQIFNWDIAVEAKQCGRIVLAGGLTPDNVEKAIETVKPYAVDVSSGVEKEKGKKDIEKMRLFIERAKSAIP